MSNIESIINTINEIVKRKEKIEIARLMNEFETYKNHPQKIPHQGDKPDYIDMQVYAKNYLEKINNFSDGEEKQKAIKAIEEYKSKYKYVFEKMFIAKSKTDPTKENQIILCKVVVPKNGEKSYQTNKDCYNAYKFENSDIFKLMVNFYKNITSPGEIGPDNKFKPMDIGPYADKFLDMLPKDDSEEKKKAKQLIDDYKKNFKFVYRSIYNSTTDSYDMKCIADIPNDDEQPGHDTRQLCYEKNKPESTYDYTYKYDNEKQKYMCYNTEKPNDGQYRFKSYKECEAALYTGDRKKVLELFHNKEVSKIMDNFVSSCTTTPQKNPSNPKDFRNRDTIAEYADKFIRQINDLSDSDEKKIALNLLNNYKDNYKYTKRWNGKENKNKCYAVLPNPGDEIKTDDFNTCFVKLPPLKSPDVSKQPPLKVDSDPTSPEPGEYTKFDGSKITFQNKNDQKKWYDLMMMNIYNKSDNKTISDKFTILIKLIEQQRQILPDTDNIIQMYIDHRDNCKYYVDSKQNKCIFGIPPSGVLGVNSLDECNKSIPKSS